MRRFLFLCAAGVWLGQLCPAAPVCVSGSLSSYLLLGSGGCTIGDNTLSNFQLLSGSFGATPIAATDVALKPFGDTFHPGIATVLDAAASGGSTLESIFTFQISGLPYVSDALMLSGSSESGDGAVSGIQNYCVGGSFGPDGVTGCGGATGALVTVDGSQNQDSSGLPSINLLSVTNDFVVDGGLSGSATGGTLTDQFTAVPEPLTFLLTGLGFAFAWGVKTLRAAGTDQELG